MKKLISVLLSCLTLSVLFAAARPSLDGRAVVADENEMPKGLFARTIGYLPGDSVTVTNPANGSTVDVLILGSIDASEGVAILLSPEAASRLAIRKDSNVQVKITKRTGSLDENASGLAVLSEDEESDVSVSEPAEPQPEETVEETPAETEETTEEAPEEPAEAAEETSEPEEIVEEPAVEAEPETEPVEEQTETEEH